MMLRKIPATKPVAPHIEALAGNTRWRVTAAVAQPKIDGASPKVPPRGHDAESETARSQNGPVDVEVHLDRALETDAYTGISGTSFEDLPLTSAADVKAAPARYMTPLHTPAMRVGTSGSTGSPTVVYRSRDEVEENAKGIAERWSTLLPNGPHRVASLLDHNRSAAGLLVEHIMYTLDAVTARLMPYTPSGPNWMQFAEAVTEFSPTVIIATPGVLLDAEHELRALGVFDEIRSTATTLLTLGATNTPAMRRRLGRSWQALVVDGSFGGTECGTIATGCRLGNLHSMVGRGTYEVLIEDGSLVPLAAGVRGELVVTPTLFRHFVLIRYVTGDRVDALSCPCGLDGVAFKVLGRLDDRIRIHGHWIEQAGIEQTVFADPAVEDYQLVADLDDNLTRIEISLLPGSSPAGSTIAATIETKLGVDTAVVDAVSPIARTAGVVKSWARTRVRREVIR
ncbi:AMP-binding protein [Rhodococcus sp. ABRD24]|uniref:phenylacetate--CoA ligase family protein n=1 Tax=Rhodococcus sp. ABRD24 TaxID=2507582 RepID=UPI0013F1466D|nr:AMP-binding protein [Rhodococcus sp. ABRD24]